MNQHGEEYEIVVDYKSDSVDFILFQIYYYWNPYNTTGKNKGVMPQQAELNQIGRASCRPFPE